MPKKYLLILFLLIATALASFALPRPINQAPDILSQLNIPYQLGPWQGKDTGDPLAREYSRPDGAKLLLVILGAGNFHHPKVCYGASGFQLRELSGIEFNLPGRSFKASVLHAQKNNEQLLFIYWLCIDKKITGWAGQKLFELRRALLGQNKTGLMVRLDVPIIAGNTAYSLRSAQDFVTRLFSSLTPSSSAYLFGS